VTGFCRSASGFVCQYHSIIAPYSIYTLLLQEEQWGQNGNLTKKSHALLEIAEHGIENYCHFLGLKN
jgi:hypothetical protein